MTSPATVLLVCTANICRSASAAALLDIATPDGIQVISAGTQALVGEWACSIAGVSALESVPADTAERLARRLDAVKAQQLTTELITRSGLILTMAPEHQAAVIALDPAAQRRTFPIRYAARLAPALPSASAASTTSATSAASPTRDPHEWLAEIAAELHDRRGESATAIPSAEAIADPHETGDHVRPLAELQQATRTIADLLSR